MFNRIDSMLVSTETETIECVGGKPCGVLSGSGASVHLHKHTAHSRHTHTHTHTQNTAGTGTGTYTHSAQQAHTHTHTQQSLTHTHTDTHTLCFGGKSPSKPAVLYHRATTTHTNDFDSQETFAVIKESGLVQKWLFVHVAN